MIKTVFHFFCFFDRIVFLPLSSFRSAVYRLRGQPSVSISIDRSLSLSGLSLTQFLFSNKNDHIFIHIGSLYSKTNKATSTCSWLRCFFCFFRCLAPSGSYPGLPGTHRNTHLLLLFFQMEFRHQPFQHICLAGQLFTGRCTLFRRGHIGLHHLGDLIDPVDHFIRS